MWVQARMTTIRRMVPIALAGICGCNSVRAPSAEEPATIFHDDLSGATLDRSRWRVYVTGTVFNNEQQAYVDTVETIRIVRGAEAAGASEGALLIQAHYRPGVSASGRSFDFVSGRIHTLGTMSFLYGTAAARIKLPAGAGLWPAFWLLGNGAWPETGEIDVMENVGDPAWISVALHGGGYFGNTPLARRDTLPAGFDAVTWHVYATDWTPDSIVFRVDNVAFYRVSRSEVEQYGPWAFANEKHVILNLALGGAYPAAINGVQGPYVGLADSTVQRIRNGEARLLVDWVRITQPRRQELR
jgi:beta-glucanase (GH16 family)